MRGWVVFYTGFVQTGGKISVSSGSSSQEVSLISWNSRFVILFNFRPRVV